MNSPQHQFDLRIEADRAAFNNELKRTEILLPPGALDTAGSHLSDDWLQISSMQCRLDVGPTQHVVSLPYWAEIVCALHNLRTNIGLLEQVRRLRPPSHEKLDTALVVTIAGRYLRTGYSIEFEPNGFGGSDLLIHGSNLRSYIEVKRENWHDQLRSVRMMSRADQVGEAIAAILKKKLDATGSRMEICFPKSFSEGTIQAICTEIEILYESGELASEISLQTIPGSRVVVLPRSERLRFTTGLMSSTVSVPPASTIDIAQHLAVTVSFAYAPNLSALANNLRKAFTQLGHDLAKDQLSQGLIVVEMMSPPQACREIEQRFSGRLSSAIPGVVVIGRDHCIVRRSDVSEEKIAFMAVAAQPTWPGRRRRSVTL